MNNSKTDSTGRKRIKGKQVIVDRDKYNEYHRQQREAKREEYRKYNREYNKKWRKENGYHNEVNSKKRYPEKQKAREKAQRAVASGKIKRKSCETCGKRKGVQMHHEDYSKPLEVKFFCPLCHSHHEERALELQK